MIEIKNISMYYGSTEALSNVSFSVKQGEILGLLGPNGAGKTTLMRILTTFLYPGKGTAKIGGFDVAENPLKVRELVGYLPESAPLYLDRRVDEYLTFVANARGIEKKELQERFNWIKKSCGIKEVWKHTISELSKGYRQRVGLAQALIHDPKILILDEPTSGLDPLQIIGIRDLIKQLAKQKTIIFSTHILQEAEAIAERIVIINEGKIVAQGSKEEIAEKAEKFRVYSLVVKADKEEADRALSGLTQAKKINFLSQLEGGLVSYEIMSGFDNKQLWQEIAELNKEKQWLVKTFSEKEYDLEAMFISLLKK